MTKIVYCFFYLISLLPWRVIYALADFEYLFVYHVVGYRKKIVRHNLSTAFPEKSPEELRAIERKFYHWFCDYFFEAVKLLSLSREDLKKHFHITNSDEIEACFEQGQNVGTILGHYCNWEWLSCVGAYLPDTRVTGLVYTPLHSKAFDYLFQRIRTTQPHSMLVPKRDILRALLTLRREGDTLIVTSDCFARAVAVEAESQVLRLDDNYIDLEKGEHRFTILPTRDFTAAGTESETGTLRVRSLYDTYDR